MAAGSSSCFRRFCVAKAAARLPADAKLRFEERLAGERGSDTRSGRPTAFFKSLSGAGQAGEAGQAVPEIYGDGKLTRCKPISDDESGALYKVGCIDNSETRGPSLPRPAVPAPAISLREQGNLIFEIAGREPRFKSVSPKVSPMPSGCWALGAGVFPAGSPKRPNMPASRAYYDDRINAGPRSETGE